MSLSSSKPQTNFEQPMTPSGSLQNNLKRPARKLLQEYRNSGKDSWDNMHCPQYIDFTNIPDNGDSFFGKYRRIVCTPKEKIISGSSTHSYNENTQIESLNASPLPRINIVPPEKEGQNAEDLNEQTMESNEPKHLMEVNTSQKIATSTNLVFQEKENNFLKPAARFQPKARPLRKYRNSGENEQNEIFGPQFVEFAHFPETGEFSFGKHKVVVSTPKVNAEPGSSTHSYNENTLIESLNTLLVSGIDIVPPEKEEQNAKDTNEQSMEQSVNGVTVIQVEKNEPKDRMEVNKPLNIATSTARFHGRDENKQDNKPERIEKNLEQDKHPWVFRAKPLPKYLIARKMELNKNNNISAEKMDCDDIAKKQKLQCPDKNKKNTEVWKRPPLVPRPAQKNACRPKSPPLRTKGRAEERKRFDQAVKMNETKAQLQRQMGFRARGTTSGQWYSLSKKYYISPLVYCIAWQNLLETGGQLMDNPLEYYDFIQEQYEEDSDDVENYSSDSKSIVKKRPKNKRKANKKINVNKRKI
ncbi:uncharacterized protein LOC143213752 isoform X2 [Lasioglossum baleicum]|uniref:uncharacterized protein LOC143213752 isoform X2 n=1 Tax=Lasioglossum baleicum TaxID=434251 RepID=UPI003FCEDFCC